MNKTYVIPEGLAPSESIVNSLSGFLHSMQPNEIGNGLPLLLRYDKKSDAYYLLCQLKASLLVNSVDLEAAIDSVGEDEELYKLNRDITEDKAAFKEMETDAKLGRSFEDIVVEHDESYRPERPLKVYGGQHRIRAIEHALGTGVDQLHGIRVYFGLSREQKVEIATVNNTSIAVPNDLIDRMREQLLGSELRDWCQAVGLLDSGQDFADRKTASAPSVRVIRTLLVNYFRGKNATSIDDFHQPIVCKSGGVDDAYQQVRESIDWNDEALLRMGREFAKLHHTQLSRVTERDSNKKAEYSLKAISHAVVAAWGYAAGLFQEASRTQFLSNLYGLPDSVSAPDDPLNALELSQAKLEGIDPDTYRGLGARSSPEELGRVLEVFIVVTTQAATKRISKKLANAAIKQYQARKTKYEAAKAVAGL